MVSQRRIQRQFFLIREAQQFCFGDGLYLQNFAENCILYWAIHAHQRHGFRAPRRFSSSQREGCDVHAEASQRAADLPDDPWLVVIAQIKDGAAQLRLKRNSVDREHPW